VYTTIRSKDVNKHAPEQEPAAVAATPSKTSKWQFKLAGVAAAGSTAAGIEREGEREKINNKKKWLFKLAGVAAAGSTAAGREREGEREKIKNKKNGCSSWQAWQRKARLQQVEREREREIDIDIYIYI
jgi:hypothetical protein